MNIAQEACCAPPPQKLSFYIPTLCLPLMAPSPQQLLSSVSDVAIVENSLIDFFSNLAKVKTTI